MSAQCCSPRVCYAFHKFRACALARSPRMPARASTGVGDEQRDTAPSDCALCFICMASPGAAFGARTRAEMLSTETAACRDDKIKRPDAVNSVFGHTAPRWSLGKEPSILQTDCAVQHRCGGRKPAGIPGCNVTLQPDHALRAVISATAVRRKWVPQGRAPAILPAALNAWSRPLVVCLAAESSNSPAMFGRPKKRHLNKALRVLGHDCNRLTIEPRYRPITRITPHACQLTPFLSLSLRAAPIMPHRAVAAAALDLQGKGGEARIRRAGLIYTLEMVMWKEIGDQTMVLKLCKRARETLEEREGMTEIMKQAPWDGAPISIDA
eukprot:IDg11885t1